MVCRTASAQRPGRGGEGSVTRGQSALASSSTQARLTAPRERLAASTPASRWGHGGALRQQQAQAPAQAPDRAPDRALSTPARPLSGSRSHTVSWLPRVWVLENAPSPLLCPEPAWSRDSWVCRLPLGPRGALPFAAPGAESTSYQGHVLLTLVPEQVHSAAQGQAHRAAWSLGARGGAGAAEPPPPPSRAAPCPYPLSSMGLCLKVLLQEPLLLLEINRHIHHPPTAESASFLRTGVHGDPQLFWAPWAIRVCTTRKHRRATGLRDNNRHRGSCGPEGTACRCPLWGTTPCLGPESSLGSSPSQPCPPIPEARIKDGAAGVHRGCWPPEACRRPPHLPQVRQPAGRLQGGPVCAEGSPG